MVDNRALLLVEDAIKPEDLDRAAIESKLKEAERGAEEAEEDSEETRALERDVKRYEAFLSVLDE